MDKRKKDRLIKGILLNSLVITACGLYVLFFLWPKYTELGSTVDKINTTILNNTSLQSKGVNKESFREILTRLGKMQEMPENAFADGEKLNRVLTKPSMVSKDYISWLADENSKLSVIDKEIQSNDAILGNIIPIFSNALPGSGDNTIENQLTLRSFVGYIENKIIGKYALKSYAPLGISNITFPDKKDVALNIGSLQVVLDFKAKNEDIKSFIADVQQSGKLTIRNGKLVGNGFLNSDTTQEKGVSNLSNLLVDVESLSLADSLANPNAQNNGTVTLLFYVEGLNYQKILAIRSLLLTKYTELQKSAKEKGGMCAKAGNALCNESATNDAITAIKVLVKNLAALQPKIDSMKKGDVTMDMNKEMESLYSIKASLQAIEMIYLKNNAIIERAKKLSSTK